MASLATFASSTSATCSKPASTASGDVLVALVASAGAAATITGFTSQASANYFSFYFSTILTKVAGGSEPSSYSVSAGPIVESFIILRVTDADTSSVIDGTPTTNTAAGTDITNSSITTTVADSLLVIGAAAVWAIGNDASMSEVAENGPGSTYSMYGNAAIEARGTAGATGTRTQTGYLVAQCMVAIKGAAASPDGTATTSAATVTISGNSTTATGVQNATATTSPATVTISGGTTSATAAQNATATTSAATVAISGGATTATAIQNATAATSAATITISGGSSTATGTSDAVATTLAALIALTGRASTAVGSADALALTSSGRIALTGRESTAFYIIPVVPWDGGTTMTSGSGREFSTETTAQSGPRIMSRGSSSRYLDTATTPPGKPRTSSESNQSKPRTTDA